VQVTARQFWSLIGDNVVWFVDDAVAGGGSGAGRPGGPRAAQASHARCLGGR
jgi:hypothetical protein